MTEKELIGKIRELRQIKPRKEWVSLTKSQILGEEPKITFIPFFKPAFAGLVTILVLFGLFGFAQNSLPGDLLYPIKKIVEKSQAIFVSEEELPAFQLKLANERLEELTKASAKNLAPAINEFQVNVSQAAKNLKKLTATTSDPRVLEKIVKETKKFDENKQKVESLGIVVVGTEELENSYKTLAEREIENLKNSSLTENQEKLLDEAKEYFEKEDYLNAFIKAIEASQVR